MDILCVEVGYGEFVGGWGKDAFSEEWGDRFEETGLEGAFLRSRA